MADILQNSKLTNLNDNYVWMPVIDGIFTGEPFLPENPEITLHSGNFNKDVEVIIGSTDDEGILFLLEPLADPSSWGKWKDNWSILGPTYLFGILEESDITEKDIEKANTLADYYVGSLENIDEKVDAQVEIAYFCNH